MRWVGYGRPVNRIDRAYRVVESNLMRLRFRSPNFDHFSRAALRFWEFQGSRLAAAIAYYGFFAIFALLLIGYSIFGILLTNNPELLDIVGDFLRQNLPFIDVRAILDSGQNVGLIGLIGLTFTGVAWIEAIRSSQRLIWRVDQQPGYVGLRQLLDLLVLLGVLVLLALSQLAVYGLARLITWLAHGFFPSVVGLLLRVAVNLLLAAALLVVVPRLRMTLRRAAPSVLLVGVGITLLNTVGKSFVGLVQRNPAYGLVGSAVGVLVYLYVFNQLLLFGAAWAATSAHGRAIDLSSDDKSTPVGQNTWIRDSKPE